MTTKLSHLAAALIASSFAATSSVGLAANSSENLRSQALEVAAPGVLEGFTKSPPNPRSQPLDYQITYDTPGDSITVYVFRATHPNAALWFERADSVLNVGRKGWQLTNPTAIERITAFGASAPNGLRRAYRAGKDIKSTALAVIQVNDWIVKVRSSSTTLDREAQLARLARILAAISVKVVQGQANPLDLPAVCEGTIDSALASLIGGKLIEKPSTTHTLTAGVLATGYALGLRPTTAIWTDDAPDWAVIDAEMEQFPRQPPSPALSKT